MPSAWDVAATIALAVAAACVAWAQPARDPAAPSHAALECALAAPPPDFASAPPR